jgi:predicted adenylyl cyclase CyaB
MNFEIEKKARLDDPSSTLRKLGKIGRFAGRFTKEDRYYLLRPGGGGPIDMRKDPILRIRIENGRCVLCSKKRSFRGKTEINEEAEIPAGGPRETIRFFERTLGLAPFVRKRKRTTLFIVRGIHVEVNRVDRLGWFLEAEIRTRRLGPREEKKALSRIDTLFDRLGVRDEDVEPRYYIELLMDLPQGRSRRRSRV